MKSIGVTAMFALAAMIAISGSASAATDQGKCYASQLKALGTFCAATAKCEATAIKDDTSGDCVTSKPLEKARAKVEKAEEKYECIVEGENDFSDAVNAVRDTLDTLAGSLDPGGNGDTCGAKKLTALGKLCSTALKCYGNDLKTEGKKSLAQCLSGGVGKAGDAYERAEAKGDCATEDDAAAMIGVLDENAIGPVAEIYNPSGSTTTTTTTTTSTTLAPANPCADSWVGGYEGEFAGSIPLSGTFDFVVDAAGNVTGTATTETLGDQAITGTVDALGNISGSLGVAGMTFSGTLDCTEPGDEDAGSGTLGGTATGEWSVDRQGV